MAPSVNLALHLRLARILTGESAAGDARLGPEALECLSVLDDLMVAMDERVELLRLPEAVEAVEAAVEVVVEKAEEVSDVEISVEEAELVDGGEEMPTLTIDQLPGAMQWGPLHDKLYEDVLWLFKMGDNEGALNSLARLLDFGEGTEELERFLSINRQKLYDLYHRIVGEPGDLIERQEDVVIGDRYFYQRVEVEGLLDQVNGARPIGDVIEDSDLSELKVYSYLHRIRREGLVRIQRSDA
jgi:hypothetical protein